jgi:hypothetical protein
MIRPHACPHCQCPLVEPPRSYYDILEARRQEDRAQYLAELEADRAGKTDQPAAEA